MDIKSRKSNWRATQKELRSLLETGTEHEKAISLLNQQHSILHSQNAFPDLGWSFEDFIFKDLSDKNARTIPEGFDQSIIWIFWHMTRIEDICMNILVAGEKQVFVQDEWFNKLSTPYKHCGFAMESEDVKILGDEISIQALKVYRSSVGKKTESIINSLTLEEIASKVAPDRIQMAVDAEAVLPEGQDLLTYWGRMNIAGILLMPPTRHSMHHISDSIEIKSKLN